MSIADYEDLKDMMFNSELLLDLNIIDFSVLRELCIYLIVNQDEFMLKSIVTQLTNKIKEKLETFEKEATSTTFSVLLTYSYFFMILLLNLKTQKNFIHMVFKKESKLVKVLINLIKSSRSFQNSNKISKVFCNLFLDEYKEIYFLHDDPEIVELFILNNEKFSKVNVEGMDVYPKKIYQGVLESVLKFNLSYELIFSNLSRRNSNNDKGSGPIKNKYPFEETDKPVGNY